MQTCRIGGERVLLAVVRQGGPTRSKGDRSVRRALIADGVKVESIKELSESGECRADLHSSPWPHRLLQDC